MDVDQADAEAKRRWGPDARAQPCTGIEGHVEIVVDIAERAGWNVKKWGPFVQVLGFGTSWEEALTNAINRQFEPPKPASPIAEPAENGDVIKPVQLDFFETLR